MATQEGSFAYHTIQHNHSFRSMDCSSSMIRNFYQQKFTCARTKCEAIVKNVFTPWALELVSQDLMKADAIALPIDTSNHGHLKLLPILAQFYNHKSNEIATELIDFVDVKGETAEIISSEVLKVIEKFGVSDKIVAMSADNTNSNFGGLNRAGRVNVHTKVKTALQREVIGLGCPAHIVHNTCRTAMDTLPVDVEYLLQKIYGYFHIYTVRVEALKDFCDFVGEAYQTILSHSNVRWLSMLPAVERILQMYAPLKSYFLSLDKCPTVLRKLFDDPLTKLWMTFAHANLTLFSDTIRQLEYQHYCAVKTGEKLKSLRIVLSGRLADDFIPKSVSVQLFNLSEEGHTTKENFLKLSRAFYSTAVAYLNAWGKHVDDLKDLQCLLLKKFPERSEFQKAGLLLQVKCPNVSISIENVFDEVTYLQQVLNSDILSDWKDNGTTLSDRWKKIFELLSELEINTPNLRKLSAVLMCLPGSNAIVERIFSQMNALWTNEKNRFPVETIKSILMIKSNINLSCDAFAKKLAKDKAILKKIHGSEKYVS